MTSASRNELRVLLVEDSEEDAELIRHELAHGGYDVKFLRVDTESEYLDALRNPWDVIISDYAMPQFNGLRAFSLLREQGIDVPFLFVSGAIGEERAVEAMRAGARDYLLKGNLKRLIVAVRREIEEFDTRLKRREAEEMIRRHERRLEMGMDATGAAIYEHSVPIGRTAYFSKRWAQILGLSLEELPGQEDYERWFYERLQPDDIETFRKGYADLVDGNIERFEIETRMQNKQGHFLDVAFFLKVAERDPRGRATNLVGVMMDITERKRLEAQMRQTQKMEAVGRLAGGIAHDFNNVLTAIVSFARFALDEVRPGETAYEDIQEVISASKRAESLTRQLLAFSRRQTVNPRVIQVNTIVSGVERMLQRLMGEDIEYKTKLERELWHVRMDPGALEQVLMNLAINARDAMPSGGTLTIETANVEVDEARIIQDVMDIHPGKYVRVSVADTGTGIDDDTMKKIFEPFFTTKPAGKGTGLGLATCYGIVKQAGGWIGAKSRQEKGAVFDVYLPRCVSGKPADYANDVVSSTGGTETILIVEDQDQVRRATARALRDSGYRVLEASNGSEATMLFEQVGRQVDLLLTDVVMPTVSGRELAKRLVAECPQLKVLFMSGYIDDAVPRGGTSLVPEPLLSKPFTPGELTRKVRDVLDGIITDAIPE